ncbi:MAG: hypothetical protein JST12_08205 [Armatimonadetes bacterium]|nr:hypothetical protein [Armatimonadota bacterium]MBS1701629.1 hypothetical protein [Armatimonadota bacterium]MBS1727306.1 hypothetical protein [Armatimonadota bacterium]
MELDELSGRIAEIQSRDERHRVSVVTAGLSLMLVLVIWAIWYFQNNPEQIPAPQTKVSTSR